MLKTVFDIPKMDCAAEEQLIRMKMDEIPDVRHLEFDLSNRRLTVFHERQPARIEASIRQLNLDGKLLSTEQADLPEQKESAGQVRVLWTVLAINFAFFLIEMTTGWLSGSMGLVADSLDMLADAFVYGISLFAVGGTVARKKQVATLAGYAQMLLALIGFVEVLRRFLGMEAMPDFRTMIVVSVAALVANGICLYLLQKSKSKEAHIQASMIFTSNDVLINLGVITAGILVSWLDSNKPDLIIGTIVFVLVVQGALRILKLGKQN